MGVSTHILDTSHGCPAAGVAVRLDRQEPGADAWRPVGSGRTNDDGRVPSLASADALRAGTYRIRFEVGAYFAERSVDAFYPHVEITFRVGDPEEHYHVPLLLNPFGYSTYRGS